MTNRTLRTQRSFVNKIIKVMILTNDIERIISSMERKAIFGYLIGDEEHHEARRKWCESIIWADDDSDNPFRRFIEDA